MVTIYKSRHAYDYDFSTATRAYFAKYPNPYSGHVTSCDTISRSLDSQGRLVTERLIHKQGKMPMMLKAILGSITDTWTLESSIVDLKTKTLTSWTRNLDHTHIMRVEDLAIYSSLGPATEVSHKVQFHSGLKLGIKDRLEEWGKSQFVKRISNSQLAMAFAMQRLADA